MAGKHCMLGGPIPSPRDPPSLFIRLGVADKYFGESKLQSYDTNPACIDRNHAEIQDGGRPT